MLSGADLLPPLLKRLVDPEYAFSDQISTVLSNLSRQEETCRTVLKVDGQIQGTGERMKGWRRAAWNRMLVMDSGWFNSLCWGSLNSGPCWMCTADAGHLGSVETRHWRENER